VKGYIGEIVIDNQPIAVLLSLTDDDEALIGTRLLDKKIITLNFKDYIITTQD
jgi:predicted aspartyl protease